MADTFWAPGLWSTDLWAADLWSGVEPVTVPDVVGMTQQEATEALELAGFVVAVVTASSSTVALGDVVSQEPQAGASAAPGATVTITVSLGDTNPLDVKFSAKRPNVKMRRLEQIQPKEPLPAQITNMPGAQEPVEPVAAALARGLVLDELPTEEPAAPAPEPKVEVVQEAGSGLTPRNAGSTPAPDATPEPVAPPTVVPALTRADLEAETLRVTASVGKAIEGVAQAVSGAVGASLTGQLDGLVEVLRAVQTELSGMRADWAADRKAQALKERNAIRAKEIADRLLKGD